MAQGAPLLAFGFADGNAELVLVDSSPIRVDELIWDPKAPTQGGKP
jgi:hypothetical protein